MVYALDRMVSQALGPIFMDKHAALVWVIPYLVFPSYDSLPFCNWIKFMFVGVIAQQIKSSTKLEIFHLIPHQIWYQSMVALVA